LEAQSKLQKNKNNKNNNKLEMEKREGTLDESSIIRQKSMLLKVEKTCHPTPLK
jgi:hypothetical protein